MPQRVQRMRSKGWRMPENTVYVGRPTRWGNPNDWRWHGRTGAVKLYKAQWFEYLSKEPKALVRLKQSLGGKNLACWCPLGRPCHADVLLELANQPDSKRSIHGETEEGCTNSSPIHE